MYFQCNIKGHDLLVPVWIWQSRNVYSIARNTRKDYLFVCGGYMRLTVRITDHWTCMLSCRKVTD